MDDPVLFSFFLSAVLLEDSVRAALERRLGAVEGQLHRLILLLALGVVLSVVIFVILPV